MTEAVVTKSVAGEVRSDQKNLMKYQIQRNNVTNGKRRAKNDKWERIGRDLKERF